MTAQKTAWGHLVWVLAGALLGMAVAAVFAGVLRLPRNLYLVPYVVLVSAFLWGYVRWSGVDLDHLIRDRRGWGLLGAVVVGAFVVSSVLRQPSSPTPQGFELMFDLLWLGVVYGTLDGLLLSVLPVYATWKALSGEGWTARWPGRIGAGILALLASSVVTAAYHLGYPEFRGPQVMMPVFGVGVMSLSYILTRNPLSPVLSHVAMHVAAVLHGLQSVLQLPPHYA
ncbi:MAG: CPBP family glutamic-type intramembrane protease [Thermodesulfobacteriota bacterium]